MEQYSYSESGQFKVEIQRLLGMYELVKSPEARINFMQFLSDFDYFTLPASKSFHHIEIGGLYHHSYEVMKTLTTFGTSDRFAFVVGLFHDICKLFEYSLTPLGQVIKVLNNDSHVHGKLSVEILNHYLNLTLEEQTCIEYHMGAYSTDPNYWSEYANACSRYPNLILVHAADMLSSIIK